VQLLPLCALLVSPVARAGGGATLPPIAIDGNAALRASPYATYVNGAYVFGPASITSATGDGISIRNVTIPFLLQNMTINGAAGAAIRLTNVQLPQGTTVVAGTQTSLQKNYLGISVSSCSGLTLDGGGASSTGPGVSKSGIAGTINKNYIGAIDVQGSTGITVRGWQTSANGQDGTQGWPALGPDLSSWGVGAVRFVGVSNSTIDHNSANNDTSISYSLWGSSNNRVTSNTGDYPFTMNMLVAAGSSYNLVDGNDFGTADFVGVLVGDPLPSSPYFTAYGATSNNVISNNFIHTDGPTGSELNSMIAPNFTGGIVVLNSAANNQITGNTATSDSGLNLAWAEETLDTTPIGVAVFKVTPVACATQVSGFGAFNGNQWSGNTIKTQQTCGGSPLQP
jgi:hypothetical protein